MKLDLLKVVEESFSTYAAMTILDRAIVDVRDAIKPSARQCMYAQLLEKITYKKPFKKSNKSVAAAMDHFYVHGDFSCYGLLTRMAKDYSMRYPLEDFDGSYGTITHSGSEAASRYTSMRLGELGSKMFENIDKDTISRWYENYDNTESFPSVLPSVGYYNICNGSIGIATGIASSIPQFNLTEVNEALIKLCKDSTVDFEEIYCPPDFCTGATILNGEQVKESLRTGRGKSAIIRSSVSYDSEENCLYVTEVPYSVYTSTICQQIEAGIENGELLGIKSVLDLSNTKPNIKILLEKGVNYTRLLKALYKHTSLQSAYTINMTMLDNGERPKTYGWKEALLAHLEHEKIVYKRIHEFEIKKIDARLNIITGLLLAIANIDEVVQLIRSSKTKIEAKEKLVERFGFNEEQVDSILKMTLSKLINLEVQSYKDEEQTLIQEKERHQLLLTDSEAAKEEIIEGLQDVINKHGDDRRTKVINLQFEDDEDDSEPIEEKELIIYYTNLGNIYTKESTSLTTIRRGGKGTEIKLKQNESIIQTIADNNLGGLLFFSNKGLMYSIETDSLPINSKINVNQLFNFEAGEEITALTTFSHKDKVKYFVFITKKGMVKKTKAAEYSKRRTGSLKAINLKDGDEVLSVLFVKDEPIGLLTNTGNFVIIRSDDISSIGRVSMGVKGINLAKDDFVIDAKVISGEYLITVSKRGLIKKANLDDFPLCSRGIKGKKISGVQDDDQIVNFLTLCEKDDIMVISSKGAIKFKTEDLRPLSRTAIGVQAMKKADDLLIVKLIKG